MAWRMRPMRLTSEFLQARYAYLMISILLRENDFSVFRLYVEEKR